MMSQGFPLHHDSIITFLAIIKVAVPLDHQTLLLLLVNMQHWITIAIVASATVVLAGKQIILHVFVAIISM